jgi:sulfatase maturation enzyme AslB (radical SAM superfamily)
MARRIRRRRARLRQGACSQCEYFRICNGGCLASAWLGRKQVEAPDYFCEGRRVLFQHASQRIAARLVDLRAEAKSTIYSEV